MLRAADRLLERTWITPEAVEASEVVITMGCGDACPYYLGKRYLDWGIADPSQETLEGVREIVETIDTRVQALWDQIRD